MHRDTFGRGPYILVREFNGFIIFLFFFGSAVV